MRMRKWKRKKERAERISKGAVLERWSSPHKAPALVSQRKESRAGKHTKKRCLTLLLLLPALSLLQLQLQLQQQLVEWIIGSSWAEKSCLFKAYTKRVREDAALNFLLAGAPTLLSLFFSHIPSSCCCNTWRARICQARVRQQAGILNLDGRSSRDFLCIYFCR